MRSLFVLRSLVAGSFVFAVGLSVGVAGCTDKACIRWTVDDRPDGGVDATSGAGGSGGAADAGAMPETDGGTDGGTGGGTDGGTGGGTDGGTGEVDCPSLARARELLGQPSCAESIESIEKLDPSLEDGLYDPGTDRCCYAVTTKTKPCGDGEN